MIDVFHTNKQRIEKLRIILDAFEDLAASSTNPQTTASELQHLISNICALAQEADGSLEALEDFLSVRNALETD